MSDVDWRVVLAKYMKMVCWEEGVTFLSGRPAAVVTEFSEDEWTAIKQVEAEVVGR